MSTHASTTAMSALANALTPEQRIALAQVLAGTDAPAAPEQEAATCGAPTSAGTPCTREVEAGSCFQHEGRTHAEWATHHAQVRAEKEAYKASPERQAKAQARKTRKWANRTAAAWARENGFSASGPEWEAKRDELLGA